ncbi:hypothetical protein LAV_00155 [Sphingobium phage Lacusarx]|uniref:Uncharacterized protein n=1 Tax=Sphingobium phage Lacusarx TaxID=1980139 RepID=A0A1W6DWZ5_9CAUD|nr:hypothetical protein FDH44_gp148 [Sphingobium phage Lacusarx]ARK07530.1 hypothetical protein LAV_00155 [Sphingobium phage Lacusarx]
MAKFGNLNLSIGDLVVIEHPHAHYAHVVARIARNPTDRTVMVIYFKSSGWSDEPRRRNLEAVQGKLPIGADPATVSERLQRYAQRLRDAEKAARTSYHTDVSLLVEQ